MKGSLSFSSSSVLSAVRLAGFAVFVTIFILYLVRTMSTNHIGLFQKYGTEHNDDSVIYVITSTNEHLYQRALLTQMAQTISMVPSIFWIVIEDSGQTSERVERILQSFDLKHRSYHFAVEGKKSNESQRDLTHFNDGLQWLRSFMAADENEQSVVYFANENYIYSVRLFEELNKVQRGTVGVFPVAFEGGALVEMPIVQEGRVVDFTSRRTGKLDLNDVMYPIHPAGFAVSSDLLLEHTQVTFGSGHSVEIEVSKFLEQLITSYDDLQPLAFDCSEVLVWHIELAQPDLSLQKDSSIDLSIEV